MAHKKFSEHYITTNMPTFSNIEEVVAWFDEHSGKHCPDKLRTFIMECEGRNAEIGPRRYKKCDLNIAARNIAYFEYCMKDEHFATGWLERDGTTRSNCYTGHAQQLFLIGREYSSAERNGWMHVSTDYATTWYEPTKKQLAVIDRLKYSWNSKSEHPKWRAPKKAATVAEQVADLSAIVQASR